MALNLSWVDSLEGLPEIIGHQIFSVAERRGVFSVPSVDSCAALGVFLQAYQSDVLSAVDLSGEVMLAGDLGEFATDLFSHVTHLNLSHSKLRDRHEMIQKIAHLDR